MVDAPVPDEEVEVVKAGEVGGSGRRGLRGGMGRGNGGLRGKEQAGGGDVAGVFQLVGMDSGCAPILPD